MCSHSSIEDECKKATFSAYYILLFQERKKATETHTHTKSFLYGEGAVADRMCPQWFVKFHNGGFSLGDAPQSGRPVEVDSDQIETLIENNQRYTMRKTANILKTLRLRAENHLHPLGYVHHFDVCVPHKLSGKNLLDHISAWNSLLKHNENILF